MPRIIVSSLLETSPIGLNLSCPSLVYSAMSSAATFTKQYCDDGGGSRMAYRHDISIELTIRSDLTFTLKTSVSSGSNDGCGGYGCTETSYTGTVRAASLDPVALPTSLELEVTNMEKLQTSNGAAVPGDGVVMHIDFVDETAQIRSPCEILTPTTHASYNNDVSLLQRKKD